MLLVCFYLFVDKVILLNLYPSQGEHAFFAWITLILSLLMLIWIQSSTYFLFRYLLSLTQDGVLIQNASNQQNPGLGLQRSYMAGEYFAFALCVFISSLPNISHLLLENTRPFSACIEQGLFLFIWFMTFLFGKKISSKQYMALLVGILVLQFCIMAILRSYVY